MHARAAEAQQIFRRCAYVLFYFTQSSGPWNSQLLDTTTHGGFEEA